MKISSYLENHQRGTPDFPAELYLVNENHPSYRMHFHWHSDIEIIHISEGVLQLTLNDAQYVLRQGESVVIPGGIVHGAVPTDCQYECLVFSKSLLYAAPGIKNLIKTKFIYPVKLQSDMNIEKLFSLLRENDPNQLLMMSLLFSVINEAVGRQNGTRVISEEKIERIKPAITYIEDYYHGHITVAQLAKECLMSSNYFIKYFKEVTAQTPVEFLNKYRVEAACKMILSGHSVTETAFACGFNDLSYFIHVFKKETGISPKKYATQKNVL